jgi:hypothetical protein
LGAFKQIVRNEYASKYKCSNKEIILIAIILDENMKLAGYEDGKLEEIELKLVGARKIKK